LTLAGDLGVILGIVMVVGGVAGYLLQARLAPIRPAPSADSIAAGEALYLRECSVCHGETGRGDGPLGLTLRPPPAVLTAHVPLHNDEELFGFISQGFPGTAMRAYETELSAEEIWNLVNYLRDRYGEFVETP
jgi:high-affinity iron transporter